MFFLVLTTPMALSENVWRPLPHKLRRPKSRFYPGDRRSRYRDRFWNEAPDIEKRFSDPEWRYFSGAPEEDEEVPVVRVAEGASVRVPCPLAARGTSVQWVHRGAQALLGEGRTWAVRAQGEAALAIQAARPSDAGHWGCREAGGREARVLLLKVHIVMAIRVYLHPSDPRVCVAGVPFLEVEGRRLLPSATVTVKEPTSLLLHCVVRGEAPTAPLDDIQWFVGDSNVTSSAELFVEESDGAWLSRSALPLNATRALHGREVVCRPAAHRPTPWAQDDPFYPSAHLNVLYEPSFSISRSPGFGLPLVEGMRVSLECAVDANPPSPAAWVRDDRPPDDPLDEGGEAVLVFDPVDRGRHSGWYRCTTRHPQFGFFASFGLFLNVRAAEPTSGEASPGGDDDSCHGRSVSVEGGGPVSGTEGGGALLSTRLCSPLPPARVFWLIRQVALRPGDQQLPYTAHELKEEEESGCWSSVLEVSALSASDSGAEVLLWAEGAPRPALFHLHVTPRAAPRANAHALAPGKRSPVGKVVWEYWRCSLFSWSRKGDTRGRHLEPLKRGGCYALVALVVRRVFKQRRQLQKKNQNRGPSAVTMLVRRMCTSSFLTHSSCCAAHHTVPIEHHSEKKQFSHFYSHYMKMTRIVFL
ncbi:hypothetical protein JTE90_003196 [Oedothorax gibbosus]|uniref:Ig-like domain-containing protein n=1 Tax=Oedothorax gibbosus TaxID=931172 RepID=A0AAV6UQV7_9ARAC|nr:hypothetical protein JTE90_003196 [Oedothorax gibbosus]